MSALLAPSPLGQKAPGGEPHCGVGCWQTPASALWCSASVTSRATVAATVAVRWFSLVGWLLGWTQGLTVQPRLFQPLRSS